MNDSTQTETVENEGIQLSQKIIGFVLEIAQQLKNHGISEQQAVTVSLELINKFAEHFKGAAFYFQVKRDCPGKVFLESGLNEKLRRHGIARVEAGRISAAVIDHFFQHFKSLSIYIPLGEKMDKEARAARNEAIISAYRKDPTPATITRLRKKYSLATGSLYQIINNYPHYANPEKRKYKFERDRAIFEAYNKKPSPATIQCLAGEHGLSAATVYDICKAKRKEKELEEGK